MQVLCQTKKTQMAFYFHHQRSNNKRRIILMPLKLSKLENQGLGLDFQTFRLDEQIREVILFLQPKWEQLNLILDLSLPRTSYYGNEEFLYQVWLNLMDNAIHAASVFSGERYISVYASVQGVYLTVRVTNSSDNPAKKSPGRKGCGIEIIKDIVEEYQGHYSGKWENNEYKTIVSVADCLRKPGTEKLLHASEDRGTNLRP